jgi:hypothetical protein
MKMTLTRIVEQDNGFIGFPADDEDLDRRNMVFQMYGYPGPTQPPQGGGKV